MVVYERASSRKERRYNQYLSLEGRIERYGVEHIISFSLSNLAFPGFSVDLV